MRFRYSTEKNGKPVKKAIVYTQDEHGINFSDVDAEAVHITERLKANGYETYIVGGAVRDLILGKKPKDFDIATAANPAKIKRIFRNSRIIGRRFRLVHVYFGPKIYEVSTFRSIKDGPTGNTFGTIEEDVLRRDFTLNALFYDPLEQIVVDYVGGMKDIAAKRIRPIIPLATIFTDDPVRMLRAVKYGAATGFSLSFRFKWKIRRLAALLGEVSPSRLTEEVFKIIHSPAAAAIVKSLDEMGLYRCLQPAAAELFVSSAGFREKYLAALDALNREGFKNLPGEAFSALIGNYLEGITDWEGKSSGAVPKPLSERYKEAFAAARKFIYPINPPRVELDHAVRLLFAAHGVTIKRSMFSERPRRGAEGKVKTAEKEEEAAPAPDETVRRKRRRRRRPGPEE